MIAFVRGVIFLATSAGSIKPESGSISAQTGIAPRRTITPFVAVQVCGVVMTSSSGSTPQECRARSSAAVQELAVKIGASASSASASSPSNASTRGPWPIYPDCKTSATAAPASPDMKTLNSRIKFHLPQSDGSQTDISRRGGYPSEVDVVGRVGQ